MNGRMLQTLNWPLALGLCMAGERNEVILVLIVNASHAIVEIVENGSDMNGRIVEES